MHLNDIIPSLTNYLLLTNLPAMPKRLRNQTITIAPGIRGRIGNDGPEVFDEILQKPLDPNNVIDKIRIYQRQVENWFLKPAKKLVKAQKENNHNGFIVLMICLSYIEGIEQYRQGRDSRGHSKEFFIQGLKRLYPNQFGDRDDRNLINLYRDARCGLFHNGMVEGTILINSNFPESIKFETNSDIKINHKSFLRDIEQDFKKYITELTSNEDLKRNFDSMFSVL